MSTNLIFSVLVLWILQAEGKTSTISFSKSTCLSNYLVTSTSDISLVWDGRALDEGIFDSCSISFTPEGSSETVCVEVESFHIEDCNVNVEYSTIYSFTNAQTYGCKATPQKFCGDEYETVTIEISHETRLLETSGSNSFRLKIYNPQHVDYVWIIVFVGITLGIIISTVVIILVCRRLRSKGIVLNTSQIPHTRLVNCPDPAPYSFHEQDPNPDQHLDSNPPPYSPQQPVTREYTITVPVAVNFS